MRVVVMLAVWLSLARANASETIVAASTDAGFTVALEAALASAGMSVVVVHDPPQLEVSDLTGGARRLADRESATATIALVFGDDGATLLAYDLDVDRVLVRSLPYHAPLTEAQAAELARTARAMLHALRVTPDIDAPPPHATEAAAIREHAALPPPPTPPPSVPVASVLALELVGGARLGTANSTAAEHGAIALVWRPAAPGLALAGSFVPSRSVETMAFSGSVSDLALAITGRVPLRIASRWTIVGEGGVALHRIRIAGDNTPTDDEVVSLDGQTMAVATWIICARSISRRRPSSRRRTSRWDGLRSRPTARSWSSRTWACSRSTTRSPAKASGLPVVTSISPVRWRRIPTGRPTANSSP